MGALQTKGTMISVAETVAAGAFAPPQGPGPATSYKSLPAFCRIVATLHPVSDSHIGIEVWLPMSDWNGKL
jgi:feruloyl esterase